METLGKIGVAIIAAIGGFLAVSVLGGSGDGFDYTTASLDEKQRFLERKAENIARGFRVTAGKSSKITQTFADAELDLVSLSITLERDGAIPAGELAKARNLLLKTACTLTERKLLTETPFKLRIRYFAASGGSLMTVEADGESCTRYFS